MWRAAFTSFVILVGSIQSGNTTETWSCTYRPWVDLGRTAHAEIRFNGKTIEYRDDLFPGVTTKPLQFDVLSRSDLGFVAVSSLNAVTQAGAAVGATVLIVKLPGGEFSLTAVYGGDQLKQSVGVCNEN